MGAPLSERCQELSLPDPLTFIPSLHHHGVYLDGTEVRCCIKLEISISEEEYVAIVATFHPIHTNGTKQHRERAGQRKRTTRAAVAMG